MADEQDDQMNPPSVPVKPIVDATFPPPRKQEPEKPPSGKKKRGVAEAAAENEPVPLTLEQFEALSPKEQWPILVKAFERNRPRLLRIPGVLAVDIGYKIVNREFTNKLALRVHLDRKLPPEAKDIFAETRPYDFIPKCKERNNSFFRLDGDDVRTDVIEADYEPTQFADPPLPDMVLKEPLEANLAKRRRRLDPLVGGISIGSAEAPAGTLGALVWDITDGSVCILSNWHVLSGDPRAEAGTPCFQPGRLDQGRASDEVALLKRWSFDGQTDAAIAELTGSRHYCTAEILSLLQQITGTTAPFLGMRVQKVSRSTGFTWGFVDGLYFTSTIEFNNGIVKVFEDQIHIAPAKSGKRISEPGDSGALWVADTGDTENTKKEGYKAVGLHFAGDSPQSSLGEYALANPMSVVMERLGISFRPRFLEVRDTALAPLAESAPPHPARRGRGRRGRGPGGQPDPIDTGSS